MATKQFPRHLSSYAWEKSYLALRGMASSPKTVQQRAGDAFVFNLMHIHEENVTPEIWKRLDALRAKLSRYPAQGDEGNIAATAARIGDEEARDNANEITDIYWEICQLHLGAEQG
jgi:hypothetical protein